MAPPTAYRHGIVHFRALYSFIRLLPAFRLFRRLRRANTGLRLGIKLWGPEGYPNNAEGLAEAWDVMERDLVGLDVPLERMIPPQSEAPTEPGEILELYSFQPLELFGSTYELGVTYRPNVDFDVEDKESILSEQFVDMEEDWFTPTVTRHRLQSEARATASATPSQPTSRATDAAAPPSPTPSRVLSGAQTSVAPSRASTSIPREPSSLGAGKWGALAEGLPFATGSQMATGSGSGGDSPIAPSPTATAGAIPYRRLSAHSLQPFRSISASPSTSILRGPSGGVTPLPAPVGSAARTATAGSSAAPSPIPGSLPRMSEFLSSSGRSFSHAQLATMASHPGSAPSPQLGGASPPPGTLSFAKQTVRQPPLNYSTSSPFIPSSLDRESSPLPSPSSVPKRYSASFAQRRLPSSSPSESNLPASLLRRQSTRESGLRHSIDEPRPDAPDKDDVHAFLRALDSWTPPASIAPHQSPRATATALAGTSTVPTPPQTSTTSSVSVGSYPSPKVASGSVSGSPAQAASGLVNRTPLTRQHVDDMLKLMAGSFSTPERASSTEPAVAPSAVSSAIPSRASSHLASRRESLNSDRSTTTSGGPGLLSASRPCTSPAISPRSNTMPLPGSSLRHGSLPRSGALPFAAPAHLANDPTAAIGSARSLPGPTGRDDVGDTPGPLRAFSPPAALSPQTTGGTDFGRRRGPVLVRGGFGAASSKASTTGSSPSHSPVRDYMRPYRSGLATERDRDRDEADSRVPRGNTLGAIGLPPGYGRAGRTAPSSLGAEPSDNELENATGSARMRARAGRVASEGSTSPNTRDRSRSPVVEGLMARLALADQKSKRDEKNTC